MYECPWCTKKLTRTYGLKQHMKHACKKKPASNQSQVAVHTQENAGGATKKRACSGNFETRDPLDDDLNEAKRLKLSNIGSTKENLTSESKGMNKANEIINSLQPQEIIQLNVGRNVQTKEPEKSTKCPHCSKVMKLARNLSRHLKKSCPVVRKALTPDLSEEEKQDSYGYLHPADDLFHCSTCDKKFANKKTLKMHIQTACKMRQKIRKLARPEVRRGQISPVLEDDVFKTRSAFNKYLSNYQIMNKDHVANTQEFLESKRETVKSILMKDLQEKTSIKFCIDLEAVLQAPDGEVTDWTFKTENEIFLMAADSDEAITQQFNKVLHRIDEEMLQGSGWAVVEILNLIVRTNKYEPLKGSSYMQLPEKIANKKAIINPINLNDQMCFKYAILASLHEGHNPERISNLRQYEDQFNWEGLSYPVSVHDVKIFEKNNENTSVSIYAIEDDDIIVPLKVADPKDRHFDLLLLAEDNEIEGEEPNQHYTYIKRFNALFYSQISKKKCQKFICKRCLTWHASEANLAYHTSLCNEKPLARVMMPKSKTKMEKDGIEVEAKPTVHFSQPQHSCTVPVRIFADSEAMLLKSEGPNNDPAKSSSAVKQYHVPMSFGYVVVSDLPEEVMDGITLKPKTIREVENPTKVFLEDLVDISKKMKNIYAMDEPMADLTSEEQKNYDEAEKCYMCDLIFDDESNWKVRDHCHVSGKFRGAAHKNCNIQAKNPNFLPVYLHNNSHYDSHFIIKQLGDIDCQIKVIPNTSENLITFSIIPKDGIEIRFLDSFRFMSTSLENLVDNLTPEMFVHVQKHFGKENMHLLRRKGVFCYDYVDNLEKLKENKLPSRENFYSELYECDISKKDYKHAWEVFNAFKCKDIGAYSDLYLKLDVLLLADVFEAFRQVCLQAYHLDPCWYYTAPGLAWNAALRKTGVKLDLLQDEEMLLMIEQGIRGGVAQCMKRYAKARNRHINVEDSKYKKFIAYLDANNLYGWAMSQLLPKGNFHWVDPETFMTEKDISILKTNGETGFIFEVDVKYPKELHDIHKDLPFLPETRLPPEGKHKKLLTTLYDKEKYVVHYRLLQQALENGLKITKVHRVIGFDQEDWLKEYIEMNTDMRKRAKNSFEKDFFKLMNNAVFGKTMENVRNRINLEIVNNVTRLRKLLRSPFFKRRIIYDENLCAVISQKKTVIMNKPIYVGMAILDLSKMLMYDFHYKTMVPRYGAALSLCYMDTDSFVYFIDGIDLYEEMEKHKEDFDTSDYPSQHPLFDETNKKVLGKFKDEANSEPVKCFVGLRAKMYAMQYGGKVVKRAKGVKKHALKNKITYNDYVTCLKDSTIERVSFQMIQSREHVLVTKEVTKVSLSSSDDKRFILPNKVDTLPHGHYRIPTIVEDMEKYRGSLVFTDQIELEMEETLVEPPNDEVEMGFLQSLMQAMSNVN